MEMLTNMKRIYTYCKLRKVQFTCQFIVNLCGYHNLFDFAFFACLVFAIV